MSKTQCSSSASELPAEDGQDALCQPSEMSLDDFQEMVKEINEEWTESECQPEVLHASRHNEIDVVRGLLLGRADLIHFADQSGNTALHMAAANGHAAVVRLLLAAGADPEAVNKDGNTPLHWAASNGKEETVQALLHSSADVLQRNAFGRSALTEGFTSQNTELVKALLEHDSASEEKLVQSTTDTEGGDAITHDFLLARGTDREISLSIRELAIARNSTDSILGQQEPDQDTTGLSAWASSIICAQWIARMDLWEGKTVLELGAGCGIPGLVAAKAGARRVYVSDFNSRVVENLKHNVNLNGCSTTCTQLYLNWRDPSTWPEEEIDVVLGSDLVYQPDMVPLLCDALVGILAESGKQFYYVCPESGRLGGSLLLERLTRYFALISQTEASSDLRSNPLRNGDDESCFLHFNELQDTTNVSLLVFERRT